MNKYPPPKGSLLQKRSASQRRGEKDVGDSGKGADKNTPKMTPSHEDFGAGSKLMKKAIQKVRNIKWITKPEKDNGIKGIDTTFLQNNFFWLLVGKPNSGKSHLLTELIKNPQFYGGKFDHVFVFSPTPLAQFNAKHGRNYFYDFDLDVVDKIIAWLNQQRAMQVLFVIDDCAASLRAKVTDPRFYNLFFNRRHMLKSGGAINFLMTTQKYTVIPHGLRLGLTGIVLFHMPPVELQKIQEELITRYEKANLTRFVIITYLSKPDSHNNVFVDLLRSKILFNFESELKS